MKPDDRIELPPELKTKAVRKIFKILQGRSKEPQLLFVGGCVRNALLGEDITDIDLATVKTPNEVLGLLEKENIKVVPTGLNHGTVTAIIGKEYFQITTLRRDVETDGRRSVVAFTDDWAEDAARRDFTLNTLLCDLKGNIFDPLLAGLEDLRKKRIAFVGEAEARIQEDYLRILRFFRFQARYGSKKPDLEALNACKKFSKGLKLLSKERVTQEILKIISGPNAAFVMGLMRDCNVLKTIAHPKFQENHFNYLYQLNKQDLPALGLLVLGAFSKTGTRRIENNLKLPKNILKQIDRALFYLKTFKSLSENNLRLLLYKAGREIAEYVLISRFLMDDVPLTVARKWLKKLSDMEPPVLPLRGQDLIDQGMKPGPEIKKTLEKFERSWIRNNFRPTI